MSMDHQRVLALQQIDFSDKVADGDMISTVTIGSDFSLFQCCTEPSA